MNMLLDRDDNVKLLSLQRIKTMGFFRGLLGFSLAGFNGHNTGKADCPRSNRRIAWVAQTCVHKIGGLMY
jgi:hypothetical protein